MSPTGTPLATGPRGPLRHVALAGVLGICAAVVGTPVVVATLFGGWVAASVAFVVLVAVVSTAAVALDRSAGPAASGIPGSLLRGTVLATVGSVAVAVLAWAAIEADVDAALPVPLRYAAAALPFAAVAALQWPGPVRVVAGVVVVGAVAALAGPPLVEAAQRASDRAVTTEVGTTAHPWVTDVDGFRSGSPQHTGTELLWTPYRPDDGEPAPELWLFRTDGLVYLGAEPCADTLVWTPGGEQTLTSCTPADGGRWLRTTEYWQELLGRHGDVWVGVAAPPDVPQPLLAQALDGARPMTDDEYAAWLDEVMPETPVG